MYNIKVVLFIFLSHSQREILCIKYPDHAHDTLALGILKYKVGSNCLLLYSKPSQMK